MRQFSAYIDETGDPDFNPKGSKLFLIGAVIIENNYIEECRSKYYEILTKYEIPQLKSASRMSLDKRIGILSDLINLRIKIVTILVQKDKLIGDWFRNRDTFYKYISGRLNRQVYRLYDAVDIKIDQFGSNEYQKSLKKYLQKKAQVELFEQAYFEIIPSAVEPFIQISDFIIGSIIRTYKTNQYFSSKLIEAIGDKWLIRLILPDRRKYLDIDDISELEVEFTFCLEEVKRYLDANSRKSYEPKLRALEYLYYSSIESPNKYIFTIEIIDWLAKFGFHYTEEQFRNDIIANLRDEGLVIVGTRRGIKIPNKLSDIQEYVEFSSNLVLPVMKRLHKAITFIQTKLNDDEVLNILSPEMRSILRQVNS